MAKGGREERREGKKGGMEGLADLVGINARGLKG